MTVRCPYCTEGARLSFDAGSPAVWRCDPCDAQVRCHAGTTTPLGTLADRRLRELRVVAHTAFDRLWREFGNSRDECYRWMGAVLGIQDWVANAHIAMLTPKQCEQLIEASRQAADLGGLLLTEG